MSDMIILLDLELFKISERQYRALRKRNTGFCVHGHICMHMDTYGGPRARPWPPKLAAHRTLARDQGTLSRNQGHGTLAKGPCNPGPFEPVASFGQGPGSWAPVCIHMYWNPWIPWNPCFPLIPWIPWNPWIPWIPWKLIN